MEPSKILPYLPADWPPDAPFPTEEEWRLTVAESALGESYMKAAQEDAPPAPRSLVDDLIAADPGVPFAPAPERPEDSFTDSLNAR